MGDTGGRPKRTKVDLAKVHLGISPKTRRVYVGVIKRPEDDKAATLEWAEKVERTEEFYSAVLQFCPPGESVTLSGGGRHYMVMVQDVTPEGPLPSKKKGRIVGLDGRPVA